MKPICFNDILRDCQMPTSEHEFQVLLQTMAYELDHFVDEANQTIIHQNEKIAKLCEALNTNLTGSLAALLDSMKYSGELEQIITDSVVGGLEHKINMRDIYYNGITTQKMRDSASETTYYLTIIPCKDSTGLPIKLKMGIANDDETVSTLESTLDFAHRKNATVCVNAGLFDIDTSVPMGSVIYNYKILYEYIPSDIKYGFLGIKEDGSIHYFDKNTSCGTMLAKGMKYVTCIFGKLIENGKPVTQTDFRKEPRQSIGITTDGEIIIITCDGRDSGNKGMTYDDLVRLHAQYGSHNAYILDGGGSTSTVLRGVKQNNNIDYYRDDRKVSTFLYVAKETSILPEDNPNNALGKVKQDIISLIVDSIVKTGILKLFQSEGNFSPRIDFGVNGESERIARIGISYDETNPRNTYFYFGLNADGTEDTRTFRVYPQGAYIQIYHGTTAERPLNPTDGMLYVNTETNKLMFYTNGAWHEA